MKRYAIYDNENMIFNYLHSVISTREWLTIVSCKEDNATAHATLRIRNLT
jgi:hypothetical protein